MFNFNCCTTVCTNNYRSVIRIEGDGNCLFRALSLIVYGSEMYHLKVRELLVNFVRSNADKFKGYVTNGTLEDHVLHMQYSRTWATQVELYAAASLFGKELFIYTPTVRRDKQYIWIRVLPFPPQVSLVFPPNNEPWPKRLTEVDHMELCHTSGKHFDVVVDLEGEQSLTKPTLCPT